MKVQLHEWFKVCVCVRACVRVRVAAALCNMRGVAPRVMGVGCCDGVGGLVCMRGGGGSRCRLVGVWMARPWILV